MESFYNALASLLRYPESDYRQLTDFALRTATPDCEEYLRRFADCIRALETWQLQELFTRTFDMNPVCSLELGWHLFGENYERGLLLVRVRKELRRHGLKESTELPDHLTHVLELLTRMQRQEAADFVAACVLPALAKMLDAISGKENPFELVLLAVRAALHARFPEVPWNTEIAEPLLKVLA